MRFLDLLTPRVIGFFTRHRGGDNGRRTRIAPVMACALLTGMTVLVFTNLPTLLGVAPDHPLIWVVPGAYLAALLGGAGHGLLLKTRNRAVYAAIGYGAKAGTAPHIPAPRTGAHSAARQEASTR